MTSRRLARALRADVDTGTAHLVPDDDGRGWTLELDGTPQSHVAPDDPLRLDFEYVARAAHVLDAVAAPPRPLTVLHLGGGAYTLPRFAAATRPGSRQSVVEIDALLVEFVRSHLPYDRSIRVRVGDAASVLANRAATSADAVVLDVYADGRVPAAFTTDIAWGHLARVIRPDGVVIACFGDLPGLAFIRGQLATARKTFAQLALVAEPSILRGRRAGNVLVIATHQPLPIEDLTRCLAADPVPARVVSGADLARLADSAVPVTESAAQPGPALPTGWR